MSKISSMLLLFDKNKKKEPEKKISSNTEKIKQPTSNITTQKQESSNTNNITNINTLNIKTPSQNNTISDRMKMFEKKENKINNNKKEEKKIENKGTVKKEEKNAEIKKEENNLKKQNIFEKTNNKIESNNKNEENKEKNIKEIQMNQKNQNSENKINDKPTNILNKDEKNNKKEATHKPSILERMKMFESNNTNSNNNNNHKVTGVNNKAKNDKKEIPKISENNANKQEAKTKEITINEKYNKAEEIHQIKKEEKKINIINKNNICNEINNKGEAKKVINNLIKIEEKEKEKLKNSPIKEHNNNILIKKEEKEKTKERPILNSLNNSEKQSKINEIKKPEHFNDIQKKFLNQNEEGQKKENHNPKEEEHKNKNMINERLKLFSNTGIKEQPKPKSEKINKAIKNPKKINPTNDRINNIGVIKIQKTEEPNKVNNNFNEKIKQYNIDKISKKEEKDKNIIGENKKLNNIIQNKIVDDNNNKKEPILKKGNLVSDRMKKIKEEDSLTKKSERGRVRFNEQNKKETQDKIKNNKLGLGFSEKLRKMNELFKNQGRSGERRGHSVMVPSSKLGIGKGHKNLGNNDSHNLGIIYEEYDPSTNLQQKLDGIVVNKRKRKKTVAAFKG